jgi:plastocyanin
MRHSLRWAVALMTVLAVPAPPAHAASISIIEYEFAPDVVTIDQGETVTWTNDGDVGHTSTQDAPFELWHSGAIAPGASFPFTFPAAGTYPYHCNVHIDTMYGTVRVPLLVDPDTGGTETPFTFTLASETEDGFVYDVQKRKGKGSWQDWKMGVADLTLTFNPVKTGTFRFRSRLHDSADDDVGGWSPKVKIVVS